MNLSDLLVQRAQSDGNCVFISFERQPVMDNEGHPVFGVWRRSLRYREFDQLVNQASHYLTEMGLRQGDVYNLHLPNSLAFMILWFAGARIGAVMMPTNILASSQEMAYLLTHSESRISFTTEVHSAALPITDQYPQQVVICDPFTDTPTPDSFEAVIASFPKTPFVCPANGTDLAAIMYTSGTTSKPKGVMVTHSNYLKAGQTVADAIELTGCDRQFVVLPLFHGNAQYYSTMSALLTGASIALMDRFSASQYFDKCIEYGCTVSSLFAAPLRMLLAQSENPDHLENKLRVLIYAQNISERQLQEWHARFHAPLSQLWGMTETMGPPLMNPYRGQRRNMTVGKPIGGYNVQLVDQNGALVEQGQQGEIVVQGVSGETLMRGYFKNPEATGVTLRNGWLYTGDNAIQDADGYFRFVDRIKDMIKRSGENVSAGEVESVLLQHPAVFECAVVGVPDPIKDESIIGVVVVANNLTVDESALIHHCKTHLAKFRVPQRIVFQSELPKTSVGKIQKHLIRQALLHSFDQEEPT